MRSVPCELAERQEDAAQDSGCAEAFYTSGLDIRDKNGCPIKPGDVVLYSGREYPVLALYLLDGYWGPTDVTLRTTSGPLLRVAGKDCLVLR